MKVYESKYFTCLSISQTFQTLQNVAKFSNRCNPQKQMGRRAASGRAGRESSRSHRPIRDARAPFGVHLETLRKETRRTSRLDFSTIALGFSVCECSL